MDWWTGGGCILSVVHRVSLSSRIVGIDSRMMHRFPTALSARIVGKGGHGLESVLLFRTASASARYLSPAASVPANNNGLLPTVTNAASTRRSHLCSLAAPVNAPVTIVGPGGRSFSSRTHASLLGDDGFDPFITHRNAEDADRADRMVRDYVTRKLASGASIEIRNNFFGGALNSYRVLSEKAAEQARRGGKFRRPDASFARKADDLLAFVEQAYEQDPALSPDIKSYNMVVDAYAKIGDPEGAEAVLRRLEKLWEAGNAKVKPNTILYNAVIDAWAKSREKGAAQRAEAILNHMKQLHQQGHEDIYPDTIIYNTVINAWARSREKGSAQRAEAILNHMDQLNQQGNEGVCPNTTSYGAVINAWAKSREKGAAQRAEAILNHMEQLNQQGRKDVCPSTIIYSAVINAWAKSREKGAAQRAETILDHMLKLHEGGREACCPNTTSFTTVIDAWARSRDKDAPKRAEAMLEKMEKLHGQGYENVCSNVISYGAVINAWAKSRENGAAQRAELILNHMLELHEGGREACCPDTTSFNTVIDAWARSRDKDAPKRAEELLAKMERLHMQGYEDVRPDTISYSAVINAWAKSRENGAAQRAEAILHHMLKLHKSGKEECRPNTIIYNAVIDAWSKSGNRNAYDHAKRVFGQMQEMGDAAEPDALTYTSLINALAASSVPDKATKAFHVLIDMETMASQGNKDVAPTSITFGAVMKAYARTSGNQEARRKALRVALGTFDKLRSTPQLSSSDPMMYDSLFLTIANTSKGSEYVKLVTQVFKLCCEDGALNDFILRNLRRRAPKDVFEKLVGVHTTGGRDISVAEFPADYSKNAKGGAKGGYKGY